MYAEHAQAGQLHSSKICAQHLQRDTELLSPLAMATMGCQGLGDGLPC